MKTSGEERYINKSFNTLNNYESNSNDAKT